MLKIAKIKCYTRKGTRFALITTDKVFELVIHTQLFNCFDVNDWLTEQLHGFRTKHSTELAAIKLIDFVLMEMDNKYSVKTPKTIFIDLSKAFDSLHFNILLDKLKYYGITGMPLMLIESYLTCRYQYVIYKNCESERLEIKTGIPLGYILGPLFFSIYINDIVNSTDNINFLMYADDTTVCFSIEYFKTHSRETAINTEINKVNTWLRLNKLSLNVEKTKCMLFHKRRTPPVINFSINNRDIDRVAQFAFFGVILDENLSWKNDINMISYKLSKINGVLHRLKYIFPKILCYLSTIFVYASYELWLIIWGHNFDAIYKLQKKAVRTIKHSHYIAHSEPLLKQLNVLHMKDIVDQKLLKFLHKLNTNKLLAYFNSYKP